MNIRKHGIVDKNKIATAISQRFGVPVKDINFRIGQYDAVTARFDVDNKDEFQVVEEITITEDEILDFAKAILDTKGFKPTDIETVIDHIPGDSREPLDYGTREFAGVKFYFNAIDPA